MIMRNYVHLSKIYQKGGEMEIVLDGFQRFLSLLKKKELFDSDPVTEIFFNEDQFAYDLYIKDTFEKNLVTFIITRDEEAFEVEKFDFPDVGKYYIGYCNKKSMSNHHENIVFPIFRLEIDNNTRKLKALNFNAFEKYLPIVKDSFFACLRVYQLTGYLDTHITTDLPLKKVIDEKFYDMKLLYSSIVSMGKVLKRKIEKRDVADNIYSKDVSSLLMNLELKLEELLPEYERRSLHLVDDHRHKQFYSNKAEE